MIRINIDGRPFETEESQTILEAASQMGIEIPTLCYLKNQVPDGSCRFCVVEVTGQRNLKIACATQITDGMEIFTHSDRVVEARRTILDLILSTHKVECLVCKAAAHCRLQEYCREYHVAATTFAGDTPVYPVDESNPFFDFDRNKCILCRRCVRVCSQMQGVYALDMVGRGMQTHVSPEFRLNIDNSRCLSCGNCVSHCPVGALTPKKGYLYQVIHGKSTRTVCPYCGVGCQLYLISMDNKVVGVEPAPGPANEGILCVKGKFGFNFINSPRRLTTPLIKEKGQFREASWQEAIHLVVQKLQEIKTKKGPQAIGGLASARCTNEENYLFQKFLRGIIGTNHVDHCARL